MRTDEITRLLSSRLSDVFFSDSEGDRTSVFTSQPQGYAGKFRRWVEKQQGLKLEFVYPWWRQLKRYFPGKYAKLDQGFKVIRRRWVVERTFAWLRRNRRLSKGYERLPETAETLVYAGVSRLMLKRLARPYT